MSAIDNIYVGIKSMWASKLSWGVIVGVLFNIAMLLGHPVPPEVQDAVSTLGNSAVLIYLWVVKNWFTTTITPASAARIEEAKKP